MKLKLKVINILHLSGNGISVTSVERSLLKNMIIANTDAPLQVGIDFEPNEKNELLKNIKIQDLYTYNNKNQVMLFVFGVLKGGKKV